MSEPQTIVEQPQRALRLELVALSTVKHWDRNPKLHDIGQLVQSIELHGFRDPPSYDATLDGIVEGNGRIEALTWMLAQQYRAPEGVGVILNADTRDVVDWAVPVIFGLDAPSRQAAERYGIDHNNLVMAGGDFSAVDISRTYGAQYLYIMQELAAAQMLPVSVSGDDVDTLLHLASSVSTLDIGYDAETGDGFSEGEQFETDATWAATIVLTETQSSSVELKTALQALCDTFSLKYKIAKR